MAKYQMLGAETNHLKLHCNDLIALVPALMRRLVMYLNVRQRESCKNKIDIF